MVVPAEVNPQEFDAWRAELFLHRHFHSRDLARVAGLLGLIGGGHYLRGEYDEAALRLGEALVITEADHGPDPEHALELKDTMERVNQIIGRLPEQQKTLLQMRDVEGLEYEEIADITGLEVNAIRVNISRARKKVRETIQKVYQSWKI